MAMQMPVISRPPTSASTPAAHTALPKRRVSRAPNSWARTTPAPTETPLKKHTMVEIKKAQVLTAARATLPDHCPTIMESTVT